MNSEKFNKEYERIIYSGLRNNEKTLSRLLRWYFEVKVGKTVKQLEKYYTNLDLPLFDLEASALIEQTEGLDNIETSKNLNKVLYHLGAVAYYESYFK